MAKRLILITSGFPYGKGETFLENEISYLADGFYTNCKALNHLQKHKVENHKQG
jgi:hypothetical protein